MGGGKGYTAVPDVCRIKVDARLTPAFDAAQARALINGVVQAIDATMPTILATVALEEESWPPYVLAPQSALLAALSKAAKEVCGKDVPAKVAGPSNIGNYLAGQGIETICGFGAPTRACMPPTSASSLLPLLRCSRSTKGLWRFFSVLRSNNSL